MGMEVTVRFLSIAMGVMRIMDMAMLVFEWFMPVCVLVPLRQMQPRAKPHQCSSDQ